MMKGKAVIPLVLGLCIGLVAVKFVVDTLKKAKASGSSQQTITAVRAKQDISAYALLTPEMLEVVETTDSKLVPSNERIPKIDDVKGRVTAKAIPRHAALLQSMLAPAGTPHGMEGRIKPGYRAVSVKIDEVTGVAYQVQPGDLVDVIVVMDIDTGGRSKKKQTIAEVILQRIEVAAVGQSTTSGGEEASAKVKPAKSATLLVPESDVPKLHLAATRGKITLSMRGGDDKLTSWMPTAHSDDLISGMTRDTEAPPQHETVAAAFSSTQPDSVFEKPQDSSIEAPHGVTVYRRLAGSNAAPIIERITFENNRSTKVIDVTDSPVRATGAMMMRDNASRRTPPRPSAAPQDEAPTAPPTEPSENNAG
jgi:pilus assembly protein CpaB